jgi:hypothetical protein
MIELYILYKLWFKIRAWLQHDPRMAYHAQREWIKQQSHLHPAEKGDHWR